MSTTTFKAKEKKKSKIKPTLTLDKIHDQKMDEFSDQKKSMPLKKRELDKKTKRLSILEKKNAKKRSDEETSELLDLIPEIKSLKKEIANIENDDDLDDYFLKAGPTLHQYYDNRDQIASGKRIVKKISQKHANERKTILDMFNIGTKEEEQPTSIPEPEELTKNASGSFAGLDEYVSRDKLYDTYMELTDDKYISKMLKVKDIERCPFCSNERILIKSDSVYICNECGFTEEAMVNSDKPSYKEPQKEAITFAYKRINHLNEWLVQFQGKESTEIPDKVYDMILIELKKERIYDMKNLNPKKLREILKRLDCNKYYEHIAHIINRLNGLPPPIMTRENEEKIRTMFKEVQPIFSKYCPRGRKNFLSYSYILHKFVELLDLDEFKPCFPLLKNREKLQVQDSIWEKICRELQWQFIRSI
jgi:hypothetical protein